MPHRAPWSNPLRPCYAHGTTVRHRAYAGRVLQTRVGTIAAVPPEPLVTTSDHRLPEVFSAVRRPVVRDIAAGEQMPADDVPGYLATGESALKAVRLALLAARAAEPRSILDLPCGHGRVLRWLAAAF